MSDLISRQAVLDALDFLPEDWRNVVAYKVEKIPSAERKGKCEIERAVKLLSQQLTWMYDDGEISYEVCLELSGKLMDIANMVRGEEIEERKGKWIEQTDYIGDTYYDCSVCGESWTTIDGTPWENGMNFCPHCGARMVRGEEDE